MRRASVLGALIALLATVAGVRANTFVGPIPWNGASPLPWPDVPACQDLYPSLYTEHGNYGFVSTASYNPQLEWLVVHPGTDAGDLPSHIVATVGSNTYEADGQLVTVLPEPSPLPETSVPPDASESPTGTGVSETTVTSAGPGATGSAVGSAAATGAFETAVATASPTPLAVFVAYYLVTPWETFRNATDTIDDANALSVCLMGGAGGAAAGEGAGASGAPHGGTLPPTSVARSPLSGSSIEVALALTLLVIGGAGLLLSRRRPLG